MRQQAWAFDKYLAVLWRRKLVLLAPIILGAAGAIAATIWVPQLSPRLYEATATGRLALAGRSLSGQPAVDQAEADRLRDTFLHILGNSTTLSRVISSLRLNATPQDLERRISFEPVQNTELVVFKAEAESAREAQAIANAFLDAWIREGAAQNTPGVGSSFSAVEPAAVPEASVELPWTGRVAVGVVIGIVVGVCLAFVFEYTDRTINSVSDLGIAEVPVLATIPRLKQRPRKNADTTRIGPQYDPLDSPEARLLTIKLLHAVREQPVRSILVVGCWPREGASSVATSVAYGLARSGLDVLLVDAQLSHPALHRIFNIAANRPGLTDVLSSLGKPEDVPVVVRKAALESDEPGLSVMTTGSQVAESWNLLSSAEMRQLIEHASGGPLIVLDGPPLSSSADGLALASIVGGVIVVCAEGKTTTEDLHRNIVQLDSMKANILGIVYNKARASRSLAGVAARR